MANVEIIEISCCNCGVSFWITEQYNDELLRCHNSFYCPNGHKQYYTGKTDAEKLAECTRKLQGLELSNNMLQGVEERQRATIRSNAALRGVITRMKKKETPNAKPWKRN